jgi:PPOX class probable F420-dependent enzyme
VNERDRIVMSPDEVAGFLREQRVATLATIGPAGRPHLTAMWYAIVGDQVWFETKSKSQKAVNLRRDDRVTVLVEAGHTYDTLQGVSLDGRGVIVEDPDALWAVGVSMWERYNGPYSESMRPAVELMLHKRIAVRVEVERVRSWDHRKLGLDPLPLAGTTAQFL